MSSFRNVGQFVDGGALGGVVNFGVVARDGRGFMSEAQPRQHGGLTSRAVAFRGGPWLFWRVLHSSPAVT